MIKYKEDRPLQLSTLLLRLRLLLIPHQTSQNLATRILRHYINEFHATSQALIIALVVSNMLQNTLYNIVVAVLDTGGFDNESLGNLALAFGSYSNDYAVIDGGVCEKVAFQLGWSNLMTLDFDQSENWLDLVTACISV